MPWHVSTSKTPRAHQSRAGLGASSPLASPSTAAVAAADASAPEADSVNKRRSASRSSLKFDSRAAAALSASKPNLQFWLLPSPATGVVRTLTRLIYDQETSVYAATSVTCAPGLATQKFRPQNPSRLVVCQSAKPSASQDSSAGVLRRSMNRGSAEISSSSLTNSGSLSVKKRA